MSREIKFRAYYQRFSDNVWIIEGEYTLKDLTDRGIQFDQERIKWVEYTGLKDSSDPSKEIYEGDILKIKTPQCEWVSLVWWDDTLTGFQLDVDLDTSWSTSPEPIGTWLTKCYKIIGNIYENPELLKK